MLLLSTDEVCVDSTSLYLIPDKVMTHFNLLTAGRAKRGFSQSFSPLVVFEYYDRIASHMRL